MPSCHPYDGLPTLVGAVVSADVLEALGTHENVERVDWDVSGLLFYRFYPLLDANTVFSLHLLSDELRHSIPLFTPVEADEIC